jgi:hypothetical protein
MGNSIARYATGREPTTYAEINATDILTFDAEKIGCTLGSCIYNFSYDSDIKDDCFRIFTDIQKNDSKAIIYHYDNIIFAIRSNEESDVHTSTKLISTRFAYVLSG